MTLFKSKKIDFKHLNPLLSSLLLQLFNEFKILSVCVLRFFCFMLFFFFMFIIYESFLLLLYYSFVYGSFPFFSFHVSKILYIFLIFCFFFCFLFCFMSLFIYFFKCVSWILFYGSRCLCTFCTFKIKRPHFHDECNLNHIYPTNTTHLSFQIPSFPPCGSIS